MTEKQNPCETNVVVDTENLMQCCLCVQGTFRWLFAIILVLATLGLFIASGVFLNIYYSYVSFDFSMVASLSWATFIIFTIIVGNTCFGNFGTSPFQTKKSLFWKWRIFLRAIAPLLLYLLLWLPIICQQFESTKLQDDDFAQFCWIAIGIFWLVTVLMFVGTCLTMTLFKPREQKLESDEPKETLLLRIQSFLEYNLCCMSYPPCKNCGCTD